MATTLKQYLSKLEHDNVIDSQLGRLLSAIASVSKEIHSKVSMGALAGVLGTAGTENVHGEHQKKLDVLSNEIFVKGVESTGSVAGMASEEMTHCLPTPSKYPKGKYLISFDPLDGSSNIDINAPIGTIFSITEAPEGKITDHSFLIPGRQQVAAGYAMYAPQTILTFSVGDGVVMFTLDPKSNEYILTNEKVTIKPYTSEFAINMSNMRHWESPVRQYVRDLLAGTTGVLGKNYNMRWVAAMVAEVHRILCRGGIFMYPWDDRKPEQPGKLRLMYEANPMAFLIEQAGGYATDGKTGILDIQPKKLHQRVSVILGAKQEVHRVAIYIKKGTHERTID